jgi:hypothetical protein
MIQRNFWEKGVINYVEWKENPRSFKIRERMGNFL